MSTRPSTTTWSILARFPSATIPRRGSNRGCKCGWVRSTTVRSAVAPGAIIPRSGRLMSAAAVAVTDSIRSGAIGARDAVRRQKVWRDQAQPVEIFGRRAIAVALPYRHDLGMALSKMGRDRNVEFARAGGTRPQQVRTTGVSRVRAHREANPAVAASIPAMIQRVPGVEIDLAIVAGIANHSIRTGLGIRRGEQIRSAIEADAHFVGGVEHFGYCIAKRLHHRGGSALQQLQDAKPRDGEPL